MASSTSNATVAGAGVVRPEDQISEWAKKYRGVRERRTLLNVSWIMHAQA